MRNSIDYYHHLLKRLDNPENIITLSRLFFRDYTCHLDCGGCCFNVTIDYFPGTKRFETFKKEYPEIYERDFKEENGIISNRHLNNDTKYCKYRDDKGLCTIHTAPGFGCSFVLNQIYLNKHKKVTVMKKLFGRGWCYKRATGGTGAICEIHDTYSEKSYLEDLELFEELKMIAEKLEYQNAPLVIQKLIDAIKFYYPKYRELKNNITITNPQISDEY